MRMPNNFIKLLTVGKYILVKGVFSLFPILSAVSEIVWRHEEYTFSVRSLSDALFLFKKKGVYRACRTIKSYTINYSIK